MSSASEGGAGLFPEAASGYAEVAIDRPMRQLYSYRVPPELHGRLEAGMRVAVPFARRREVGMVVGLAETCDVPPNKLKSVSDVLDPAPLLGPDLLELTRWVASYYGCSWGESLAAVLPSALKRERSRRKTVVLSVAPGVGEPELGQIEEARPKQHRLLRTLLDASGPVEQNDLLRRLNLSDSPVKTLVRRGWVLRERVEVETDELATSRVERPRHVTLTPDQERAVAALSGRLGEGEYGTFLLHGVTGSGKTEVYLRVIEEALAAGRGAIVLVPEISLTPQTVGWFRARFGDVAVLHSRMTDTQRLEMWTRVRSGRARVVVGARSAVFAPVAELGVIVVDEEHEPSFKQGSTPRYHARDVAVVRARSAGALCILGSATPSLETWRNAQTGRYELLSLKSRVRAGGMPPVEVVDMRKEQAEAKELRLFLPPTPRAPRARPASRRAGDPVPESPGVLPGPLVPGVHGDPSLSAVRRLPDPPPPHLPDGVSHLLRGGPPAPGLPDL